MDITTSTNKQHIYDLNWLYLIILFINPKQSRFIEETVTTSSYLIFYDPHVTQNNGYARSLPLLDHLTQGCISDVIIRAPGNNCNKPLHLLETPVTYNHPDSLPQTGCLLCCFCQEKDEEETAYVSNLVERHLPRIFVVSGPGFIPKAWRSTQHPLEQRTPQLPHLYLEELNRVLQNEQLLSYQLRETQNLAIIQLNAVTTAITGDSRSTLADLFDFSDPLLSVLPQWDWLLNLGVLREENHVVDRDTFIFNALRPHIERNGDVMKVKDRFMEFLGKRSLKLPRLVEERRSLVKEALPTLRTHLSKLEDDAISSYLTSRLEHFS